MVFFPVVKGLLKADYLLVAYKKYCIKTQAYSCAIVTVSVLTAN